MIPHAPQIQLSMTHIPHSFAFLSQEVCSTISPTTAMASISIFASWKQNTDITLPQARMIQSISYFIKIHPPIYAEVSQVISLFNMAQYNLLQVCFKMSTDLTSV
jgi:hypothetical protein